MPKMDGYEVLEKMKEEGIKIPVIIISNSGQPVEIEKTLAIVLSLLTTLISFIGLFFAYQPGSLFPVKNTFISVEYQINEKAWMIFQVLFSLIIICTSVDFVRNLYYWFRRSALFEEKYFFACMSALIYAMVGYFDQRGVSASWIAVLFRASLIICASIAYLAYSEKEV